MKKEILDKIKLKLNVVPNLPGSYKMLNDEGLVIYVGKAKNLNKRLRSYFTGTLTGKTRLLIEDTYDFEYTTTSSELEALILEFNLIKKYDPKYNILLKDDKSYPYIEITDEYYPKLQIIRNIKRRKHVKNLFGPYPNVTSARNVVELLNRLYPFRKCNSKKGEVCFYYHLNQCMCSKVEEFDYNIIINMVKEASQFLKGNSNVILKKLESNMKDASKNLEYEKALELRTMIEDIKITTEKQNLDLKRKYNADIFGYSIKNNYISITCFHVREGVLFGSSNKIINIVTTKEEQIMQYILKFYENNPIMVKEIIINNEIDHNLLHEYFNVKVSSYSRGDLKKLEELAITNSKEQLKSKLSLIILDEEKRLDAINELKQILNTNNVSKIEAFDNSHLFGTYYVGAMVVFNDLLKSKNEYRRYRVSTETIDDVAAMKEVVYRRYYRAIMENTYLPNVIVVDGGIHQINAVKSVLEELNLNIHLIGLKKNNKHKTNELIDKDGNVIKIKKDSNLFVFLMRIQEEVHNFAINYHRSLKTKSTISSILDLIPTIGEVKKTELLKHFKTITNIENASIKDLEKVLNKKSAKEVYNFFR